MCDKYEGWANRETWACALWLNNDQALYNSMLEIAKFTYITEDQPLQALSEAFSEVVVDLLEEQPLTSPETRRMRNDIGSIWRVNFTEIAEGFLETIKEEEKIK